MEPVGRHREALRALSEGGAALLVDVAHDDGQEQKRAGVVDAVRIVRGRLRGEREGTGTLRPETRPFDDELRRDARQFFGLFRREFFDVRLVGFKAVRPFLDEGLVVEVLLDEHAAHARDQGGVGPDAGLQVNVRDLGRLRAAGVDRDDLAAAVLRGHDRLPPVEGLRPNVRRENEIDLGVGRGRAAVVGAAEVEFFGHHAARAAPNRRLRAPSGGTEVARQAVDRGTRLLRVASVEHHALGAVLLARREHLRRDHLVGLVPTDAHPTGVLRALRVRALHGIEETVRVVEALERREPLRAEHVPRVFRPVLDLEDGVPLRMEADPALRDVVAAVADDVARPGLVGGA